MKMTKAELSEIIRLHGLWLKSEDGGKLADLTRADLAGADLAWADLAGADLAEANLAEANLAGAYLTRADLTRANLAGADLTRANLAEANLAGAYLTRAYLTRADLAGADLAEANLAGAYLTRADLTRANLAEANLAWADLAGAYLAGANLAGAYLAGAKIDSISAARLSIVPETGSFEGWKKLAGGTICHLLIPEEARRSNGTERKCRAEFVKVLSGNGVSHHDGGKTVYKEGEIVRCDEWDDNRWNTCSGGIHFYITKAEAVAHKF